LGAAVPSLEQRKVVTVLFCDVVDSTALGESRDPEALRTTLAGYFEGMKVIVERHGGSVEKFIGDAVMAVFGVPVVHEDDALRAVRAAVEMREALPALGVEGRIGVMTGEVVTGTEERLATGDVVNVAARLEQAAAPGEVLIGQPTLVLVREAVEVEELPPLELKGKAMGVVAYRLLSVVGGSARRHEAPMVGRERELDRLRDCFDQAVLDCSCQLFTILGAAGVGKSRLTAEFLASLEDAVVVRGRCLAYGEGVTYWPVVEVLKQLPEVHTDPVAAETLRVLLGEEQLVRSSEEIAWAFRKRLEAVAASVPVVCVFDDLHWGEETFLDLVEHVADLSRDAPILLLCMARPELLDRRSGWAGGKLNATNVLLEPLATEETERLIDSLADLDESLRERVLLAAEGNPLFVEEMVLLLEESGGREVSVPPTIQALLAARLDQLDMPERGVLQRAAIEGRVFHRGAVAALSPEELQLDARLTSLVRKELVRPDKAQLPGEDAYRFRHLLIRDTAYDALPKTTRAELHERFADWLEEHGTTLVELDEILGYHLEQVYRYRRELGALDDEAAAIGVRAARYLAIAGRRAFGRGDAPAALNLLSRASPLLPSGGERLELVADFGQALYEAGDLTRAKDVIEEAIAGGEAAGELGLAARARISRLTLQSQSDPALNLDRLRGETEAAIEQLERSNDELGLARAWLLMGTVHNMRCQGESLGQCAKRAFHYAQSCGAQREQADSLFWQAAAAWFGPLPVDQAKNLCEEILADSDRRILIEAAGRTSLAVMEAHLGRFTEAREQITAARAVYRDLGLQVWYGGTAHAEGEIEFLATNWQAAERVLREGYELLNTIGETGYLSTIASSLAEALYRQDRLDEAEHFTHLAEQATAPGDLASQFGWRSVRAMLLAQRGSTAPAQGLARQAVELARQTDYVNHLAATLLALAEVVTLTGSPTQALPITIEALAIYERKGSLVMAERTRAQLRQLEQAAAVP
jgi:class 3 adenylate cyclase/tetratricopeptide (TPR) repeat protein